MRGNEKHKLVPRTRSSAEVFKNQINIGLSLFDVTGPLNFILIIERHLLVKTDVGNKDCLKNVVKFRTFFSIILLFFFFFS